MDVANSIDNLTWTVDHHYLHIKNQHPFMRAWAVQFELAYTDFRSIQMALQLWGEEFHPLLKDFAKTYETIYKYESVFAMKGLDEFNAEFGDNLAEYDQAVTHFDELIAQIKADNTARLTDN